MDTRHTFNIDDFRGSAHLLVFAPSVKSPAFENQMRLLDGEGPAFDAHGLVEVGVISEGTSYCGERCIDEASAAELQRRFNVSEDDFRVILLGKEGQELHRYEAPVQPSAIYEELERPRGNVEENVQEQVEPVRVKSDVEG